jgi:predicted ABC-type ATPase
MPNLYIIAGPNGAGKTRASYTILPKVLNCYEFINADEIAKGLSPFKPQNADFEAGRIMLQQIDKHIEAGIDFAIETTLSTKYYLQLIKGAKKRVRMGGHDIPLEIIKRRYKRGLENFFRNFIHEADYWLLADNGKEYKVIARKFNKTEILDTKLFNKLKAKYE